MTDSKPLSLRDQAILTANALDNVAMELERNWPNKAEVLRSHAMDLRAIAEAEKSDIERLKASHADLLKALKAKREWHENYYGEDPVTDILVDTAIANAEALNA
jgi:hypothetical protein